jgi:hypothetical protein
MEEDDEVEGWRERENKSNLALKALAQFQLTDIHESIKALKLGNSGLPSQRIITC